MEPEKDIFEQWDVEREAKPWYKKMWRKLSLNWELKQYLWKDFKTGVKNIIYWLPIIWKDRNWNYHYIFEVLAHKLKAQSKAQVKYTGECIFTNTRTNRNIEIMMLCIRLIEKVQEEFYSMEYMGYEKTKHWFEAIPDNPCLSSLKSRQIKENFDEYFAKYPNIYKRVMNGEGWLKIENINDKHRIAINIAHINHDRANKLLFKIMEENIFQWHI